MPMPSRMLLTSCFCTALVASASALPCTLTEADYQSLANAAENAYTKEDIQALEAKDQEALCKARKFFHEAQGKDPRTVARTHTLKDIPAKISRFLTPEEYGLIRSAMSEVLVEDTMRKKKDRGPGKR
jgi:hypothetical protein